MSALTQLAELAEDFTSAKTLLETRGRVSLLTSTQARIEGLSHCLRVGDLVVLGETDPTLGEIIRLDPQDATVALHHASPALRIGDEATYAGRIGISPSREWLGRVINALGEPMDEKPAPRPGEMAYSPDAGPPSSMLRARVGRRIRTGVRAIDLFTPVCEGQRVGIFSGSGVGKSTLLGMLMTSVDFDVVVVALVGERSREVREFLEDIISTRMDRTIAVVSTSDESAMMRRLAPKTATSIAEYFRDEGLSVCLVVDSIARLAQAERDIAISNGELPIARGYPPSVMGAIAKLLERSGPGTDKGGSITAFYTVLVDGDDHNDPVADHIRGTLDGHIVLSRSIAETGRYPAIDVLKSISRLASALWSPEQQALIRILKELIASYEDSHDLRMIGAYAKGNNPTLDQAVTLVPPVYQYLTQTAADDVNLDPFNEIAQMLSQLK